MEPNHWTNLIHQTPDMEFNHPTTLYCNGALLLPLLKMVKLQLPAHLHEDSLSSISQSPAS